MNIEDAIAWFNEKYAPDAHVVEYAGISYYYACEEEYEAREIDPMEPVVPTAWRMCINGTRVMFAQNELSPDLTMQVRMIVAQMIVNERNWFMGRLEEVATEHPHLDPEGASVLRRVREALRVPLVLPICPICGLRNCKQNKKHDKKKGKKR